MILKFPDLDTLRLALTTGAVPPAVSQAAAVAGFDDQDQIWLEPSANLPKPNQNELRRLGVQFPKSNGAAMTTDVCCWLELLPLGPDTDVLARPDQTPVLFDLRDGSQLSDLVTEILRLGNDRQGYRWLTDGRNGEAPRALLRVVGPPYYSLLRTRGKPSEAVPRAYIERAPRVWVALGYTHPLAGNLKAPEGRLLLLSPPRNWTFLEEHPFRDVYEILEFMLPEGKVGWHDGELGKRLRVSLRLTRGGTPDAPELWVLRDNPVEQLDYLVQNADDHLLNRLAFAVGDDGGQRTIVLRVRPSKQPPPVLSLRALDFRTYLKLPNLFLPSGTLLHPPLRRDVVRKLLADDPATITWLYPGPNGTFTPESLPDAAFRPLSDWIDYVLDHEHRPLQEWVEASRFDFEGFYCNEEPPPKPKKPPESSRTTRPRGTRAPGDDEDLAQFTLVKPAEKARKKDEPEDESEEAPAKVEPTVLQQQLRALEEKFLTLEGALDDPVRRQLWPDMASLNGALGNVEDSGVCWMNALWAGEPSPQWAWNWVRTEAGAVPAREQPGQKGRRCWTTHLTTARERTVGGDDLDRLLSLDEPSTADVRALAAYLVFAATRTPPPRPLLDRLDRVQRFLEANEKFLPVRAVWLAWTALVRLSGGDVLGLARARDRLLERLFHNGLRPEHDLPSFLRFSGQPTNQRFRAVRQWLQKLGGQARQWLEDVGGASNVAATQGYCDLVFAYGLARLGENDDARELLARAKERLYDREALKQREAKDYDVHDFLFNAYLHRIKQALDGKTRGGPLPEDLQEHLEHMDRMPRYLVDRLRQHSRILEPDQKIDPFRYWGARISDLENALSQLPDVSDRNELAERIRKLLAEVPKGAKANEVRARVLGAGLDQAPRVNEEFGLELLQRAVPTYDALPEPREIGELIDRAAFLEKAMFVAAHFDSLEHIQQLVNRFRKLLQSQRAPQALRELDSLAGQCFRGLRKLGMRDEIDQLLTQMSEAILEGKALESLDFAKTSNGPAALRALLHVAGGWLYFGRDRQAEPVLDAARALLFENRLKDQFKEQTALACTYAQASGQAPVEAAQKRLEEVFGRKVKGEDGVGVRGVRDTYTTCTHYGLSQLDVIESVVLAVVSDDFTLGANARRWLDDDEFLVRRRVHHDLRALMHQAH